MKKTITFFLFLSTLSVASEETLEKWLKKNEPIVKEYLLTLSKEDIGKEIKGVTLSNGKTELNRAVFQGNKKNTNGQFVYKFTTAYKGVTYENQYMWVNPGGKPIELPSCKGEWLFPAGISILSGDSYTFKIVQPTGQLVVTHCILAANKSLK